MGNLERRLAKLEQGRERDAGSLSREALRFLSDEDLEALGEALEADIEVSEAWFEDLYAAVSEQHRRALDAWVEAHEKARRGGEPPPARSPPGCEGDAAEP